MNSKYKAFFLFFLIGLGAATGLVAAQDMHSVLQSVRDGQKGEAVARFQQAQKSHRLTEDQMLALSDSLKALGQVPLALDFLKIWRANHPFSRRIEERLAALAVEANKLKLAISAYKRLAQAFPKKRDYWLKLGQLELWVEKQHDAIEAYQKALALNPKDVATLRQLAKLYAWTNQEKKAYAVQTLILKYDPGDVTLWKKHGIQARWLGKNKEAIEAFKNVLLRNPRDAEAFFLLGETYLWTDQPDKAQLCLKQTLKLNPNNTKARLYWAQLRQWEPFGWWEARENYRLVLKAEPNNKEAQKGLAQIRQYYGPLASTSGQYLHDSNDLRRGDWQVHGEQYVSAQWQLRGEILLNRLEEDKPVGHFIEFGQGTRLGALWNVRSGTRFIALGGLVSYNAKRGFPLVEVQWQQRVFERPAWPGQLYTSWSFRHNQVLDGVLAVENHTTANRGKWSLYWQPDSAFHAGSDFQHSWYSDGNQKTQLYITSEWRFWNPAPVAFFLTGLFAYENMKKIYLTAIPYWTPQNFQTYSAGPALKWQVAPALWLRGDAALTRQTGNGLALNYKIWLDWRPNAFTTGVFLFQSYGSKYYSYKLARLGFSYRF